MLIGVDVNVLLDEELGGNRVVLEALRLLRSRPKAQLVVSEIAAQELAFLATQGLPGAMNALRNMLGRGYTPLVPTPLKRGYIATTARKIRDQGLVPQSEKNDSLIIAESAHQGCYLLLTSDHHCINAHDDRATLWTILADDHAENSQLIVCSPAKIVRLFG